MMVTVSLDSPSCEVTLLILYSVVYRDVTRQAKGLYRLKHVGALRNGLTYLSRYNSGWFCHSGGRRALVSTVAHAQEDTGEGLRRRPEVEWRVGESSRGWTVARAEQRPGGEVLRRRQNGKQRKQRVCRGGRRGKVQGQIWKTLKAQGSLRKLKILTDLKIKWEKSQNESCRVFQALQTCFRTQIQKLKVYNIICWIFEQGRI
jgi:hypothetical protein